ncbi:diguanylate cyclase [Thiosulfatimonas sediminis]|uniref:Diguanylate cyclase n=1 Tax=Thiosulfatimonas sediminis TaxID=2675054 RepID=A0A6F8PRH1_9GAMM|nr:ABC transporter substrate-binding protein [Thiosulfatimonas sediminis]BBP44709.1 diguanylate cyclase [Thiosulfatimonas sediminis]
MMLSTLSALLNGWDFYPMRRFLNIFLSLALLFLPVQIVVAQNDLQVMPDSQPVTLQLRWTPQFQFIGYYAALWQGYYQEAGLDVTIVPGSPTRQPHREVLAGRVNYGVGNSEVLLNYLQNKPLIAMAVVMQHSPSVFLTRKDSGIRTPQDLVGKRVMILGGVNDLEFFALLAHEGVNPKAITIMPSSYRIDDLLEGKVDVFNAYLSNEPFYLLEKGVEPFVINPVDYGVDMYSDILFTSEKEIQEHPKRAKAFLDASLKGWAYALAHQDEMIERLLQMKDIDKTRVQLENEANVLQKLIQASNVPLGNINPGRFERMSLHLQELGFVQAPRSVDEFIYDPNPKIAKSTFLKAMTLTIAGLVFVIVLAVWFWQTNRRLYQEIRLRQETQHSLEASRCHFQSIVENLQEVYYRTDMQGNILYISPSVEKVLQLTADQVIDTNIQKYYAVGYHRADFLEALNANNGEIKDYELRLVDADNSEIWVATNSQFYYEKGQIVGVEGTFREITQQKNQEALMKTMALEDPLTGVYNRRSLIQHLNSAISNNKLQNGFGAVLFMDIDNFKPVNDTHGHGVGDELLKLISHRLHQSVRKEDLLFRIGGDEFVILLTWLDTSDRSLAELRAAKVAETLLNHLRTPYLVEYVTVKISCSVGIKMFPDALCDADEIIEQADQAMYNAKKHGKDRYYLN